MNLKKNLNLRIWAGLMYSLIVLFGSCNDAAFGQEEKKIYQRIQPKNLPTVSKEFDGRVIDVKKIDGVHDLLSLQTKAFQAPTKPEGENRKSREFSEFKKDQPAKAFVNLSVNDESPFVNAEAVENRSIFEAVSPGDTPYHFFNTKYFTNYNKFTVFDNFDFRTYETYKNLLGEYDTEPGPAKVFENKQGATLVTGAPSVVDSYIRIHSDVIKNQGAITGANAATLHLVGKEVDLNNGVLEILGSKTFDYYNDSTGDGLLWGDMGAYQNRRLYRWNEVQYANFYGPRPIAQIFTFDYGIQNVYWGITETFGEAIGIVSAFPDVNGLANVGTVPFGVTELSTPYPLIGSYSWPYGVNYGWLMGWGGVGFTPYVWEGLYITGENQYLHLSQGVFVRNLGSADIEFEAKMWPWIGSNEGGADDLELYSWGTPVIEFKSSYGLTNVIDGTEQINSLYVIDQTPSWEAKWNFPLTNIFSIPMDQYLLPDSFVFTRYAPFEYQYANEPNSSLSSYTYAYQDRDHRGEGHQAAAGIRVTNIVNRLDTDSLGFYYKQAAGTTNPIAQPNLTPSMILNFPWMGRSETPIPDLEGVGALDQPGSIVISSDILDLNNARIRAEGGVTIETKHLIGSTNAVVDCQNLILRIGSTNGLLVITNLVEPFVERFTGGVEAFSVCWNQGATLVPDGEVTSKYFATIIDANLDVTNEVLVAEAILKSTQKVVLADPIHITDKLEIRAKELDINNYLEMGVGPQEGQSNWDKDVAPELLSLTINGILDVHDTQHFGTDRATPYDSWVNYGTNIAFVTNIDAKNFVNQGRMFTGQNLVVKAENTKVEWASMESLESTSIQSINAKFRYQTNIVHGKLSLDVENVLSDGGGDARSYFQVWEGLELLRLPANGNLLGTTIHFVATNHTDRVIKWPAIDYGPHERGYRDNMAVGSLILTNGFSSQIYFEGVNGQNNAIYIDYLEFEGRNEGYIYNKDILKTSIDELLIPENFVVYFASSNLPEEKLDGMYEGRLRWIKEYPGAKKSMPLYLLSLDRTIKVNIPFRQSLFYDTDEDGIANGFDLTPFGSGIPSLLDIRYKDKGTGIAVMEWLAIPRTIYHIEYKENLEEAKWRVLDKVVYDDLSVRRFSFEDFMNKNIPRRFYRMVVVE